MFIKHSLQNGWVMNRCEWLNKIAIGNECELADVSRWRPVHQRLFSLLEVYLLDSL